MAKSKRRTSLAAFLRKLWKSPQMMEQFSESRAGREKVLGAFNLSAKHRRLLLEGCVRDIVVELAGGSADMFTTVVIDCEHGTADVRCGHPECKAFIATVAPRTRARKKKR